VGTFCCGAEGGPALPRRIPKEIKVSVPTVFGVLSTIGVGILLRRVIPVTPLLVTDQEAFVVFNIYGLAFSLIASASIVIRRRDAIITILAATLMWGIFVAGGRASEMVRFILFAALITIGVLTGRWLTLNSSKGARIVLSAVLASAFCGVGGLLYYGAGGLMGAFDTAVQGGIGVGLSWGLSLGFAVGVGISAGSEVIDWIAGKAA
jgi:hypothetical protein